MLPDDCKNCKKPKTIFFTQIVEGKIKKFDLCADCPHAQAVNDPAGFGLAEQLVAAGVELQEAEASTATACPTCGFTLADFRKTGRMGCPDCYPSFFSHVLSVIRPMHRGVQHKGKTPKNLKVEIDLRTQISTMETELNEAIEREDYERAAQLRDNLRRVEHELEAIETTSGESAR